MKYDRIIDKIELYYQQYVQNDSDSLFNSYTNDLMQKILDIPYCKFVVDCLKAKFPFSKKEIKSLPDDCRIASEIVKLLDNRERYLSFCWHWYEFSGFFSMTDLKGGYRHSYWLDSKGTSMQLFKTDFIKPLLNYIILQLKEENYIIYQIKRYARRISNFEVIKKPAEDIRNKEEDKDIKGIPLMNNKELDCHKDLCLYLYDNEIDFNYSERIGNAEVDFKIPQCNEAPYIIEVKINKGEKDLDRIKDGTKQLKDYMDRMGTGYGCIFIYSQTDDNFIADESLNKEGIQLVSAYIGDNSPSKRSKTGKTIKVGLGTIECK